MEENKITNEEELVADVKAVDVEPAADVEAAGAEESAGAEAVDAGPAACVEEAADAEKATDVEEVTAEAAEDAVADRAADVEETVEAEAVEDGTTDAEAAAAEAAEEIKAKADDIVAKIKALVKDGNVTFIRIRKNDTVILNLPMTVGIIGTVIGLAAAPWAIIIATITTVGTKCTVEVEKKDGTVITIHGKEK